MYALSWMLFIVVMIASLVVSASMKSKFKRFSKVPTCGNISGRDVAERMLRDNGIYDVQITSIPGQLTDHYNPQTKTVNLSQEVYFGCNVAAAAVAAHECGHAVQHATSYAPLKLRSAMVPAVSFASRTLSWIILAGILLINTFPGLMLLGILLYGLTTIFSFITLPVEINASRRALAWLNRAGVTDYYNHDKAESALRAAAYTYVVAALSSLATLLYYIAIFNRR